MKTLLLSALILAASGFKTPQEFALPDGAVKVDDDRYRLQQTWDEAVKFYRTTYPPAKYPRSTLHSESQVRAMHIANASPRGWQGANLYETPRGEVRVFVLQSPPPPEAAPKAK
jgi:hypothetical protein